jgi:deoxyribonuclease-4
MSLSFGTAGIPLSSRSPNLSAGLRRLVELGLGCLEIEFVHGVNMNEDGAHFIAPLAAQHQIRLSVHAPYFINLNAREPEKRKAGQNWLLRAARVGWAAGAESVVFHPAFYMGCTPEATLETVRCVLGDVLAALREANNPICLRPETSGKVSQFGSLEEILELCQSLPGLSPCIDFAHLHARSGADNSYATFSGALAKTARRLGPEEMKRLHIHISGIAYGPKGELKHENLPRADLKYEELVHALKDSGASGSVICESPNLEEDALLLQASYQSLGPGPQVD